MAFDYGLEFHVLDFRNEPQLYRVGRGEQGVLLVEPYKSELLPLWKFKNPEVALASAQALTKAFYNYRRARDFVGMDMARKYLQMGFTRSRRYANHKSGKKYAGRVPVELRGQSGAHGRRTLPNVIDTEKAECAALFKSAWDEIEALKDYGELKADWKLWYG